MSTEAYQYFLSQGWSSTQSAGIVGNLLGESKLNPRAIGDGGAAFGIAQWHAPRQQQFYNLYGIPIQQSTLGQQLEFVNWELNNSEKRAGNLLRQQNTVSGATQTVMQNYERPADSSSFGSRLSGAMGVLDKAKSIITGEGIGDTIVDGLSHIPIIGGVIGSIGGLFGLGGNDDKCGDLDFVCKLRKWLDESHFWQRLAIGFLALLLIIGAIYLLGSNSVKTAVKEAVS